MRVLIVEDNAFNAHCLRRMMELNVSNVSVRWVSNSQEAQSWVALHKPDLIVIDGDLGASDGFCCNGPLLMDYLLKDDPERPVITWSNCPIMHQAFTDIRMQHGQTSHEYNTWSKTVNQEHLLRTLDYYCSASLTSLPQKAFHHVQHLQS